MPPARAALSSSARHPGWRDVCSQPLLDCDLGPVTVCYLASSVSRTDAGPGTTGATYTPAAQTDPGAACNATRVCVGRAEDVGEEEARERKEDSNRRTTPHSMPYDKLPLSMSESPWMTFLLFQHYTRLTTDPSGEACPLASFACP